YEFRHALYRNFLYQRVAPARRVQLHRRIGERGEQVFGARVAEIAATLAIHFEQGRDLVRAVKYLHLEASNDARRFAPRAAVAALERALELAAKLPAELAGDAENSLRRELERMRRSVADAEPASEPTGQNAP